MRISFYDCSEQKSQTVKFLKLSMIDQIVYLEAKDFASRRNPTELFRDSICTELMTEPFERRTQTFLFHFKEIKKFT